MTKYLNIKNICMSFILLGVVVLQACNGGEVEALENDTKNTVYISAEIVESPNDALLNTFYYTINRSSLGFVLNNGEATEIESRFVVKSTQPAANDINVRFEFNKSLITSAYSLLPENAGFTVDKDEVTIPKGETVSDTITLSIEELNELLPNHYDGVTYAYMSPVVKIYSVSGGVNLPYNSSATMASLAVRGSFASNLMTGSTTTPSGAEVTTKASWVATVGGTSYPILLDGATGTATGTYVTITNAALSTSSLEVDMQSVQEGITGIRLQHTSRDYVALSANVYTKESASGEYILQGPTLALSRPANTSPYPHSIRFVNKVNARYIKLEFRSCYNTTNGIRLTEFSIYK